MISSSPDNDSIFCKRQAQLGIFLATEPQSGKSYTFNAENMLRSSSGGTSTALAYDPLQRLDSYNPGTLRRFIHDGGEAVAEIDSSDAILNRYVRGDGADELIVPGVDQGAGVDERRISRGAGAFDRGAGLQTGGPP
jgi:hypothetical protein